MKPALLVIDVQRQFFGISPQAAASLTSAIRPINEAIAFFRAKGLPVVAVHHNDADMGVTPGSDGFAFPDEIGVTPDDPVIHKTYGNAFNKTGLEAQLRERGVDTVVLSGFCAEYCVLSTFRGAMDLDLTPLLLQGTLASVNPANIPFVESINDTITLRVLKAALR
jgi:nicotinamidase-related amidase